MTDDGFNDGDAPLVPGKSEAAQEGALVVLGLRASVRSIIDACVKAAEAVERYQHDDRALDDFLAELVAGNVVSVDEARMGRDSPKLSKLCSIGKNAELLRHADVVQYLEAGYTVLYQVVVLHSAIGGDADARRQRLTEILQSGPVSREKLIEETKAAKAASRVEAERPPQPWEGIPDAQPNATSMGDAKFDLIVADLRSVSDLRQAASDYPDRPPFCLTIGDKAADFATAVVIAPLAAMPAIENKVLPRWSFDAISQVFLLKSPAGPDVTGAEVAVVARRSRKSPGRVTDIQWLEPDKAIEPRSIALRIAPSAARRLELFATRETDGWHSIVGEANWRQANE